MLYFNKNGNLYNQIAETVGCEKTTVYDTLKRHAETGSVDSKPRPEWPCLFDVTNRNRLKHWVTNKKAQNWRLCATEIKELWKKTSQKVSEIIIRRTLHSLELRSYVAWQKPLILPINKEAWFA